MHGNQANHMNYKVILANRQTGIYSDSLGWMVSKSSTSVLSENYCVLQQAVRFCNAIQLIDNKSFIWIKRFFVANSNAKRILSKNVEFSIINAKTGC